jgi:hypothetical protein
MNENPIIIAGIPIPFRNPALLGLLAIHILAALIGAITGIIAMLSSKGRGKHAFFGMIYFRSLSVVFITTLVLSAFRWTEDYYLAILGALAFAAALLGRAAFRSQWQIRVQAHIAGMGLSYTLMLVAFYMDNGRNLPLWRDLPAVTYWLAPGGTGAALIIYALLRYSAKQGNA